MLYRRTRCMLLLSATPTPSSFLPPPVPQNTSLSVEARVEALLQRLTPQQKVAQLQSRPQNGIPELGVPAFNWQVSASRGWAGARW